MPEGVSKRGWRTPAVKRKLLAMHTPGPERGGFVLRGNKVVECLNTADDPSCAYQMSDEDIVQHADNAVALWHTHPAETAQLSSDDHKCFVCWPGYEFAIVGNNGLRFYAVKGQAVVHLDD